MELIYFLLTGFSFLLTDASADIDGKVFAAWISLVLLVAFVITNIVTTVMMARRSREELKSLHHSVKEWRKRKQETHELIELEKSERKRLKKDKQKKVI